MRELIQPGTLVLVTPFEGKPYRAKVRGYDLGHTKYRLAAEYMRNRFSDEGYQWAFINQVVEIKEEVVEKYEEGSYVTVEIKRAKVTNQVDEILYVESVTESSRTGGSCEHEIDLTAVGVTVTWESPALWPPQLGDVWENEKGHTWFARGDETGRVRYMYPVGMAQTNENPEALLKMQQSLRIVYRRGQKK